MAKGIIERYVVILLGDGTIVDNSNPLPTSGGGGGSSIVTGSWTNRSGTIAAGNSSQQLMAANANRKGWIIQNTGSDVLWIDFGVAAVQSEPSLKIPVGGGYEEDALGPISVQQINIIGPTTGQAFTVKEM
jgi:hypothetical protein